MTPEIRRAFEAIGAISGQTAEQVRDGINAKHTKKWKRQALGCAIIAGAHFALIAISAHPILWLVVGSLWAFNSYFATRLSRLVPFPTEESTHG